MSAPRNAPNITRPDHVGERPMSIMMPISLFLGVFLGIWCGTEYLAYQLHMNPSLGRHIGWIYPPWSIFTWAYQIFQPINGLLHRPVVVYPHEVYQTFMYAPYAVAIGFVATIVPIACILAYAQGAPKDLSDLHDSGSKWGDEAMAAADGLMGHPAGPILGTLKTALGRLKYLRYAGELGVTYTEPPGGGKSSVLKTNLLIPLVHQQSHTWDDDKRRLHPYGVEPVKIISDPKLELYRETSGYQQTHLDADVFLLAPLGVGRNIDINPSQLGCYNPLWAARLGSPRGTQDCHFRALGIIYGDGEGKEDHWTRTGVSFGAAVLEKVAYRAINQRNPEINSLPGLIDYVSSFPNMDALLSDLMNTPDDPHGLMGWEIQTGTGQKKPSLASPSCYQVALEMYNKDPKERAGVYSTFVAFLAPYRSEELRQYCRKSTFNFQDMANNKERTSSVYFGVDPMDIPKLRPYMRLVISDAVEQLTSGGTEELHGRSARGNFRPCVFALDETAAWRKLNEIEHGSGFFRGYGVYLWLIFQSVAQRQKYYGKENLLDETMGVQLYGAPKTQEGAVHIEKMLGSATHLVHKRSFSGGRWTAEPLRAQAQDSLDPMKLPVMTPKEIMQVPKERLFLFANGHSYYPLKPEYWKSPILSKRAQIPYVRQANQRTAKAPAFLTCMAEAIKKRNHSLEEWPELKDAIQIAIEICSINDDGNSVASSHESSLEAEQQRVRVQPGTDPAAAMFAAHPITSQKDIISKFEAIHAPDRFNGSRLTVHVVVGVDMKNAYDELERKLKRSQADRLHDDTVRSGSQERSISV